jgi:flagellar biosynthesis/type III secretory pathway chaperone
MSSLQRLAAVTEATANLIAQLHELERLRERVRKAELPGDRQVDSDRMRIRWHELRSRLGRR